MFIWLKGNCNLTSGNGTVTFKRVREWWRKSAKMWQTLSSCPWTFLTETCQTDFHQLCWWFNDYKSNSHDPMQQPNAIELRLCSRWRQKLESPTLTLKRSRYITPKVKKKTVNKRMCLWGVFSRVKPQQCGFFASVNVIKEWNNLIF